jgi:hypothetical protein
LALGTRLSALGFWLEFSTLGSAVFDVVLIGCGVMVFSTLGFGVLLVT